MKTGIKLLFTFVSLMLALLTLGTNRLTVSATTPTPAPNLRPVIDRFAGLLGTVPDSMLLCAIDPYGLAPAYHTRLNVAIADLLLTQDFDRDILSRIVDEGIRAANALSRNTWGHTRFFESGPDYVLAFVGQLTCSSGSHHWSYGGEMTVFSRTTGEYWPLGNLLVPEDALWTGEDWLVTVNLTHSSISGDYHNELWQISERDDGWEKIVVDVFKFPEWERNLMAEGDQIFLDVGRPLTEPPCQFAEEIQQRLDHVEGLFIRSYDKVDGIYAPTREMLVSAWVSVDAPSPIFSMKLDYWEIYCTG